MGAVISLLSYMKLRRAKNIKGSQEEKVKTDRFKLKSNIITIQASSFRMTAQLLSSTKKLIISKITATIACIKIHAALKQQNT
jgi:predicted histidine transporter YuiF (NhaC family)